MNAKNQSEKNVTRKPIIKPAKNPPRIERHSAKQTDMKRNDINHIDMHK